MKIIEGIIEKFTDAIEYVRRSSMGVPKILTIDLSLALTDQRYDISGNLFYVFSIPDETNYVGIKVNNTREPMINYSVHTGLVTPFDRLYITTPAGQVGNVVIIYGTEAPDFLQIIDNRSTTVAGVGGILYQLRGPNLVAGWGGFTVGVAALGIFAPLADRCSFSLQAASTNTNPIWIGFANTVTAGGAPGVWTWELNPGQGVIINDYRGELYCISNAANQVLGVAQW